MEWKRAKSILIMLFVVIDVILLSINIYSNSGKNKVEYNELNTILKANNIIVTEDAIGKNKSRAFVYEYIIPDVSGEVKKELLGTYTEDSENVFVSSEQDATLEIENNRIIYENKNPSFPEFKNISKKNPEKKLKKYLKMLGVEKHTKLSYTKQDNEFIIVNYIFEVSRTELFSSEITFKVSEKGIHEIDGTLCIPDFEKGYEFELSNIETILLNFSRNNTFEKEVKITQIKLGCYLSEYKNAVTAQALPVYMIKTADKTYLYDARDGVDSSQRQLLVK